MGQENYSKTVCENTTYPETPLTNFLGGGRGITIYLSLERFTENGGCAGEEDAKGQVETEMDNAAERVYAS